MKDSLEFLGWLVGGVAVFCVLFLPFMSAAWWEFWDTPVVILCKGEASQKTISFTPTIGKVIYDGEEVQGQVSSGAVSFSFTNVKGDRCSWTISRADGSGQTSCKDKKGEYAFGELACNVKVTTKF